ncbi:RHS repeat-associated core domain-containing protein [Pseudomonas lundensis]|uniref:RHS repeat-associated core domain-containing protein n=2 Tax=Pseudomonas lundensis TaxID=86185 RepID=UPI001868AAB2|nr:RHS repeat-associated core domain-containing protein [Pseudomonas lundensis]
MKTSPPTLEGTYQYDALDRLTTRNATRRFYQDERIATEVEGANTRRFMAFNAQPLAVQQGQTTTLLATDLQTSVLQHVSAAGTQAYAYTPYGHHPAENGITRLLAFNGEHPEAVTGHYLLGQGYRAYNPVLMRFNSPDSWSPFGEGGINAYAYSNKPLDEVDPSGHFPFKSLLRKS